MPLHPHIQTALTAAIGAMPYPQLPIAQARAAAKQGYAKSGPPFQVGAVHNLQIAGPGGPLSLRIYLPHGDGPHPVTVFFHGSGFVILDLDTHDDICRRLCVGASCMVVSVDYRLAPEHPFPAAPDDCLAATRWVAEHARAHGGDATRMVVAGDSAGGCLAAVTALRIRDEGGPALRGQLLWYPVTDCAFTGPNGDAPNASYASYASYAAYGSGYGLTSAGMQWFWAQYLAEPALASHPHASPMQMATAAGLPSAYVAVAEFDVLRDEGEAFARRLQDAGVATVSCCHPGMNHGFLKYTGVLEEADAAMDEACRWLKAVLRDETTLVRP
jgi:acetyl esterase